MKFWNPFLVRILSVSAVFWLTGCAAFVAENHGSKIFHRLHHYSVYSPDGGFAIDVRRAPGEYRKDLSDICIVFMNHDYSPESTYGVRLGFWKAKGSGTGIAIMNDSEIARMKSATGEPKHIANQRLAHIAPWDVLFYSYPAGYTYNDKFYPETMEVMLAEIRIGDQVAWVENSINHEGDQDAKYEKIFAELINKQFRVRRIRASGVNQSTELSSPSRGGSS